VLYVKNLNLLVHFVFNLLEHFAQGRVARPINNELLPMLIDVKLF